MPMVKFLEYGSNDPILSTADYWQKLALTLILQRIINVEKIFTNPAISQINLKKDLKNHLSITSSAGLRNTNSDQKNFTLSVDKLQN